MKNKSIVSKFDDLREKWKVLTKTAGETNTSIITATQANKARYTTNNIYKQAKQTEILLETFKTICVENLINEGFSVFILHDSIIIKSKEKKMEIPKSVISEHHRNKKVPLSLVLLAIAGQENCDNFEYDMIQEAAEYIIQLEQEIVRLRGKEDGNIT